MVAMPFHLDTKYITAFLKLLPQNNTLKTVMNVYEFKFKTFFKKKCSMWSTKTDTLDTGFGAEMFVWPPWLHYTNKCSGIILFYYAKNWQL